MPSADAFSYIDAPPYRVRRWLFCAPARVPLWWPQVWRIQTVRNGTFQYAYDVLGMRMRGEFTAAAVADGLIIRTISGIAAELRFAIAPAGAGTSVGVRVEYALPGALLGGTLNQRTAEQTNAAALADALIRLKGVIERG